MKIQEISFTGRKPVKLTKKIRMNRQNRLSEIFEHTSKDYINLQSKNKVSNKNLNFDTLKKQAEKFFSTVFE